MPQSSALPKIFGALSDPTRFAIVESLLEKEEQTVGELASPHSMTGAAISRHLKVLEDVGLIERRVEKQWRVCRLRRSCFSSIEDWLQHYREFWTTSFDRLDVLLSDTEGESDG